MSEEDKAAHLSSKPRDNTGSNGGVSAGKHHLGSIDAQEEQHKPPSTYEREEKELLRWPYTIHAIDDSLDADFIEARGKQLLFQALNQKTAVAFVGSGLPMAFGRLSWDDLQRRQFDSVKEIAETFQKCAEASLSLINATIRLVRDTDGLRSIMKVHEKAQGLEEAEARLLIRFLPIKNSEITFRYREVEKLLDTLRSLGSKGHFIGGEGPPIVFQVAEKLQSVLAHAEGAFLRPQSGENRDGSYTGDNLVAKPPEEGAWFGFLEDSATSPAPQKLIDKISHLPKALSEALRIANLEKEEVSAAEVGTILAILSKRQRTGLSSRHIANIIRTLMRVDDGSQEIGRISEELTRTNPAKLADVQDILLQLHPFATEATKTGREDTSNIASIFEIQEILPVESAASLTQFIQAFAKYRHRLRRYRRTTSVPEARLPLSEIGKVLLVDECAHAEQIIRNAVEYSHKTGRLSWKAVVSNTDDDDKKSKLIDLNRALRQMGSLRIKDNLRRDVHGIRDDPEYYESLGYFKTTVFQSIASALRAERGVNEEGNQDESFFWRGWERVLDLLDDHLQDNFGNKQGPRRDVFRTFVSPTHRFVFSMILAHLEHPYGQLALDVEKGKAPLTPGKVEATDLQSRRSIIDMQLDPLEMVVMHLGINRFLTTNYDLEIERFYQDRGYRRFTDQAATESAAAPSDKRLPDMDSYRVDGLGGALKDQIFRRDHAADLVAFALDEASADAHVFHLHGRTTKDSEIVATERNYMDLYLRQDRYRETVDESIRVGFAANPLVFLGLGMTEADVLRPLRQFMSDKDRAVSRTAIAVLAALGSRADQAKQAATIYLRYGTHTIYYGWARIDVGSARINSTDSGLDFHGESKVVELDWLYYASKMIRLLKDSNQQMKDTLVDVLEALSKEEEGNDGAQRAFEKALHGELAGDKHRDLTVGREIRLGRLIREMGEDEPEMERTRGSILFCLLGLRVEVLSDVRATQRIFDLYFDSLEGIARETRSQRSYGFALPRFMSRSRSSRRLNDFMPSDMTQPHTLHFECGLLGQLLKLTVNNRLPKHIEELLHSRNGGDIKLDDVRRTQKDLRTAIRELNARIIGLQGLQNAIITGALCASLENLEKERQAWWRDWQLSPPHRLAQFEARVAEHRRGCVYLPRRYSRHRLAGINDDRTVRTLAYLRSDMQTGKGKPRPAASRRRTNSGDQIARELTKLGAKTRNDTGEIEAVTGVRSFDTFLDAVEARMVKDLKDETVGWGRRWHCVAAARGTGRGAFLSAFQTERGLGQYIASSWPTSTSAFDPLYVSAIFMNIGFSTEIASTFDMLAEALIDTVATMEAMQWALNERGKDLEALARDLRSLDLAFSKPPSRTRSFRGQAWNARNQLAKTLKPLSRLRMLERLLEMFQEDAAAIQAISGMRVRPRILICVNGVDMLHYAGSLPKNREIEEFLTLLTKEGTRNCSYDLILVTGDGNLGEIFMDRTPFLDRYLPLISKLEEARPSALDHQADGKDAGKILISIARRDIDDKGIQTIESRQHRSGIRPTNAWRRTGKGKPSIELDALPAHVRPEDVCYIHFARAVRPESLLIGNFLPLATILYLHHENSIKEPEESEETMEAFRIPNSDAAREGDGARKSAAARMFRKRVGFDQFSSKVPSLSEAWQAADPASCHRVHEELRLNRFRRVRALLHYVMKNRRKAELARATEAELDEAALQELSDRYASDSSNPDGREWRHIRTVLSSNRYCLTILLAAAQNRALTGRTIAEAARFAEAFIRKTIDHVKAAAVSEHEETVLHDVLDSYEASHVIGEPHNDIELHLLILRHLASIGSPCSADVLVRTPQILAYFDRLPEDRDRSRNLRLTQALTVLAERGLVFRLEPHPQLKKLYGRLEGDPAETRNQFERSEEPTRAYRYALHRLMQRYILRKMGSGPREFAEINSFAPSLYASMPADLPRLNHETYRFLSELVDSLSQYPDRGGSQAASQRWHFGEAPHTTKVQALRCALSLVRSTFSVAVVSRFEDYNGLANQIDRPRRGYFEAYRVQVRWLIRKAWEVYLQDPNFDPLDYEPDSDLPPQLKAFYRDEIVWLYNECGVICLVQGNLLEAAVLLRQAIHLNRCIEGNRDGGAQHNRLSLNLAVTQIERGRLDSAASRLLAICESEDEYGSRRGRIWHIAHGYLGLVQHLRGDRDAAAKHYERAIEVLRIYDDLRSCSIFSKHLGDLQRVRGMLPEAHRSIKSAISFAQAGGHEDLHKRARLSQILLDIVERKATDFSIQPTLAQLRLIEDYAETMEMPSLLCDVFISRARLLLEQGESTLAGSLLARAMALAKRNGMNLRLNSAMTAYARVLAMRNLRDQADQLLFACLGMAKRNNNQIEIAGVEAAFDALHQLGRASDARAPR